MRKIKITKRSIFGGLAVFLIATTLVFVAPRPANALSYNFISKVVSVFKTFKKYYDYYKKYSDQYNNYSADVPHTFPFGGHITHSEGGCSLKYTIWYPIPYPFIGPVMTPFGGVPIPLGGNTIEVGAPLKSPPGQLFTFPYISDVYANHNEGLVGPWALGLAFTPFPISQINDALGQIVIPPTSLSCGPYPIQAFCMDNFRLDCSKDNKNVILKLGTGP